MVLKCDQCKAESMVLSAYNLTQITKLTTSLTTRHLTLWDEKPKGYKFEQFINKLLKKLIKFFHLINVYMVTCLANLHKLVVKGDVAYILYCGFIKSFPP